jgi:hypothetical protein
MAIDANSHSSTAYTKLGWLKASFSFSSLKINKIIIIIFNANERDIHCKEEKQLPHQITLGRADKHKQGGAKIGLVKGFNKGLRAAFKGKDSCSATLNIVP